MTQQQIDYWKLQESKRANQATEAENARYHRATEDLQKQVNAETQRHNQSIEAINRMNVDINARNAATNELNARTNQVQAQLARERLVEEARHNAALEQIQADYNTATIALGEMKVSSNEDISYRSQDLGLAGSVLGASTGLLGGLLRHGKTNAIASAAATAATTATAARAATTLASSTAIGGSILSSAALPLAIAGAGIAAVGIMAANNVPYPRPLNIRPEDVKKGEWYESD